MNEEVMNEEEDVGKEKLEFCIEEVSMIVEEAAIIISSSSSRRKRLDNMMVLTLWGWMGN